MCIRDSVYSVKQGLDNASIKVWNKIDKGRKAAFIRSASGLTGQHLKAQIKQFISEEQKSMLRTHSLRGTGAFLDMCDLQLKYKDKPDQFINILETTKKFVDNLKGCIMYEDMEYQLRPAVKTRREKRRIGFSIEELIRSPKKQKAAVNITLAGGASKINKKQRQQLDECLKFLEAAGRALQRLKKAMTDLGDWIAPAFNDRLNELQLRHESIQALYDEIILNDECLDFNGFIANMSAFKEVFDSEQADFAWYVQERFNDSIASADLLNKSEKGGKAAKKK